MGALNENLIGLKQHRTYNTMDPLNPTVEKISYIHGLRYYSEIELTDVMQMKPEIPSSEQSFPQIRGITLTTNNTRKVYNQLLCALLLQLL
jgi:hypothetical protein